VEDSVKTHSTYLTNNTIGSYGSHAASRRNSEPVKARPLLPLYSTSARVFAAYINACPPDLKDAGLFTHLMFSKWPQSVRLQHVAAAKLAQSALHVLPAADDDALAGGAPASAPPPPATCARSRSRGKMWNTVSLSLVLPRSLAAIESDSSDAEASTSASSLWAAVTHPLTLNAIRIRRNVSTASTSTSTRTRRPLGQPSMDALSVATIMGTAAQPGSAHSLRHSVHGSGSGPSQHGSAHSLRPSQGPGSQHGSAHSINADMARPSVNVDI